MGEKREFYASIFNYLLKMVKKYFSNESIPWEDGQEYEFFLQYHREMEELLKFGNCMLTAELYRIFNGSVHCRHMQYCSDPKKMLSEIWKAFAGWSKRKYDASLRKDMVDYIDDFCNRWKDTDIAIELIILFSNEISVMKTAEISVA